MNSPEFTQEIIEEGMDILFNNLGPLKATKFLQVISIPRSDSVEEIEKKTEGMSKTDALEMIAKIKQQNSKAWEKAGLF